MRPHPRNPLLDGDQRPARKGLILRDLTTGKIEWYDPWSKTWRKAVRLDDIRAKIIQEAGAGGKRYSELTDNLAEQIRLIDLGFPKPGNQNDEDPLNVTCFLEKDEPYGYSRNDRPEVLFTLFEPKDRNFKKPKGYLMDEGRVCLDPYLHGIRDFPKELPKTISTEVDGQDIEYYQRQNGEISRFDIMARMPSIHVTRGIFYGEPPGLNVLTQRSGRFRAKAGCLMWDTKGGSRKRDNRVLSLLPAQCLEPKINSTRALLQDLEKDRHVAKAVAVKGEKPMDKRHRPMRSEEARHKENTSEEKQKVAQLGSVTPAQAKAGNSRRTKVRGLVPPGLGYEGSIGRPQSVNVKSRDELHGTASQRRRIIQDISSDSESCFEVTFEPSPKRQKVTKGVDAPGTLKKRELAVANPKLWTSARKTFARARILGCEQLPPSPSLIESHSIPSMYPSHITHGAKSPKYSRTPKYLHTKYKALHNRVAVTGILAQYVIEMIDDSKSMYEANFQAETDAALASVSPDYRYKTPYGRATDTWDRAHIRRALELTCIDFCQHRGQSVPRDLLAECHNESYMSQYRKIQAEFDRVWSGELPVNLYCLPAWTKGFDQWKVPGNSGRGPLLKHGALYSNGHLRFYGLLDQEKQVAKLRPS